MDSHSPAPAPGGHTPAAVNDHQDANGRDGVGATGVLEHDDGDGGGDDGGDDGGGDDGDADVAEEDFVVDDDDDDDDDEMDLDGADDGQDDDDDGEYGARKRRSRGKGKHQQPRRKAAAAAVAKRSATLRDLSPEWEEPKSKRRRGSARLEDLGGREKIYYCHQDRGAHSLTEAHLTCTYVRPLVWPTTAHAGPDPDPHSPWGQEANGRDTRVCGLSYCPKCLARYDDDDDGDEHARLLQQKQKKVVGDAPPPPAGAAGEASTSNAEPQHLWKCFSCRGTCTCSTCRKRKDRREANIAAQKEAAEKRKAEQEQKKREMDDKRNAAKAAKAAEREANKAFKKQVRKKVRRQLDDGESSLSSLSSLEDDDKPKAKLPPFRPPAAPKAVAPPETRSLPTAPPDARRRPPPPPPPTPPTGAVLARLHVREFVLRFRALAKSWNSSAVKVWKVFEQLDDVTEFWKRGIGHDAAQRLLLAGTVDLLSVETRATLERVADHVVAETAKSPEIPAAARLVAEIRNDLKDANSTFAADVNTVPWRRAKDLLVHMRSVWADVPDDWLVPRDAAAAAKLASFDNDGDELYDNGAGAADGDDGADGSPAENGNGVDADDVASDFDMLASDNDGDDDDDANGGGGGGGGGTDVARRAPRTGPIEPVLPDERVAILCGLIELLYQSTPLRNEILAGVNAEKDARAELQRKRISTLRDAQDEKVKLAKTKPLEPKFSPTKDKQAREDAMAAWEESMRLADDKIKEAARDKENDMLQLSATAYETACDTRVRFHSAGTDIHGNSFYALSPLTSYLYPLDKHAREGHLSWSLIVHGTPFDKLAPGELGALSNDGAPRESPFMTDAPGDEWFVIEDPAAIKQTADWIDAQARQAQLDAFTKMREQSPEQDAREAWRAATQATPDVAELVSAVRTYGDFLTFKKTEAEKLAKR